MDKLKVLFMGTPDFAVHILDAICQSKHEVLGVVTTPDKPAGRGQRMSQSAVKKFALSKQLPIWQPEKLKDPQFIQEITDLHPDAFVVVAFRMLPEVVYSIPPKGTFNVHASLLPQYRGAAPIQWAIMNGETKTGVTTFFLDKHTDTGDIIGQKEVEITDDDNGESLHDKLMEAGADLALQTLQHIAEGTVKPIKQSEPTVLKAAPKIFKADMFIHWDDTAEHIHNKIRGLSPYPTACTKIQSKLNNGLNDGDFQLVKIYKSSLTDRISTEIPGTILLNEENKMYVSTKNTDISIEILQLEGKKRMDIRDFLKGFRCENYTLLFL